MKIGFDAKRAFHNSTGLGNYSRDFIRILAEYYPNNKYYLYNPKPKKIDRLPKLDIIIERLPNTWFWKKISSIWRQGPVVEQVNTDGVEIFHGLSGEIPRGLKEKGIKSVVTIHDLIFVRYPELYKSIDRKIYFKKFKYAADNTDKIIAISEQTKNDIVEFLNVDESKIEVVYQGCHNVFKEDFSDKDKELLKAKYKLPDRFLLNVGTLEPRKNALSIVKAIKDIETNLVIVGRKTEYYNEIKNYITQHNLTDKVIFLEGLSLKELAVLYQSAELFIYPSVFEGFGIPIIEALFSKTPVITTKGGVFPEAGGPSTSYVEFNNIKALETEIKDLLSNESLRERKIEEGLAFAQKFTDDQIAKEIFKVYNSLLDE